MKIRLIKDWSFHKAGEIADIFEPTARNWIQSGIAEEAVDSRSIAVNTTDDTNHASSEKAVRKHVPSRKP